MSPAASAAHGHAYAATDKAYTADQSVDGVADTWDQPLRGNFNQLRKLKKKHPNLKVLLVLRRLDLVERFR